MEFFDLGFSSSIGGYWGGDLVICKDFVFLSIGIEFVRGSRGEVVGFWGEVRKGDLLIVVRGRDWKIGFFGEYWGGGFDIWDVMEFRFFFR